MREAATSLPSGEMQVDMIGVGCASTSPIGTPDESRKCTRPSAPPATISPSGATASALSGVENEMICGEPSGAAGQIRTVAS